MKRVSVWFYFLSVIGTMAKEKNIIISVPSFYTRIILSPFNFDLRGVLYYTLFRENLPLCLCFHGPLSSFDR